MLRSLFRWMALLLALFGLCGCLALMVFVWLSDRRESLTRAEAAPKTGRFVYASDVDVFIQEAGPRDGPAVLFVHGTGAWSETWRETLVALANAGFHAIAMDLPPFGYSQRPSNGDYGKRSQGKRILGVLESLGVNHVVLVGHSFGGGPTMEAAFLQQDRFRALVLVDVALGLTKESGPPDGNGLVQTVLKATPLRNALVASFLTNPLFTKRLLGSFLADAAMATDARVRIYQQPLVVKGTTQAAGEWLPELITPAERTASNNPASYAGLKMPALVLWGGKDTITPLPQGQELARITPGAKLVVMENVGHIPQVEDNALFNNHLLKFLVIQGQ